MTHSRRSCLWFALFAVAVALSSTVTSTLRAQVPSLVTHQGRVTVAGLPFEGTGRFKFALVDATGGQTYWSHDGTSTAGSEPTGFLSLPVAKGLYVVTLGDTSLAGMSALAPSVFNFPDVRLRVWFNDQVNGSQRLLPDQRLTATPYALQAAGLIGAPSIPVEAWGDATGGGLVVPAFATGVSQIAAGSGGSLALLADRTVVAWGNNATLPGGVAPATFVAAGVGHHLVVTAAGTVIAWGRNDGGQVTVPGGLTTVKTVAGGERHSLALLTDGTVRAWGDNTFGQTTLPGALTGATITAIAAGYDHSLALTSTGTVIAWGRNDTGQITLPAALTGATVKAIAAGAYHSLALKSDGTVVAWGWNSGGQTDVPVNLINVVALDGGYLHSAAVTASGTVVSWGDNSLGQTSLPTTLGDIVAVSSQGNHTLALRAAQVAVPLARVDKTNTFAGKVGIGRDPATNALEVAGNASKSAAGSWLANSDARIKTEVQAIPDALALLARVQPVTFRYTPAYLAAHPELADVRFYNVIAQQFRTVFPDAVTESGETLPDGSPVLQVDTYPALITALSALQELNQKHDRAVGELRAQNAALAAELAALRQRLDALAPVASTPVAPAPTAAHVPAR